MILEELLSDDSVLQGCSLGFAPLRHTWKYRVCFFVLNNRFEATLFGHFVPRAHLRVYVLRSHFKSEGMFFYETEGC